MKNRFSKILSIIIAFAMICSMTVIAPMTVMAERETVWEEVWSQNFDNLVKNQDGTYNLGGTNTTALEIDPATYGSDSYPNTRHAYLSTREADDYALTLTHTASSEASIPINAAIQGLGRYKLTYDWQTNCADKDTSKSRVWYRTLKDDGSTDYYQVSASARKIFISGGNWGVDPWALNTWHKIEVIFDYYTMLFSAVIYDGNGETVFSAENIGMQGILHQIELYGLEGGGQKIDNIVLSKEVEKGVTDEPVDDGFEEVWSQNFDNLTQNDDGTYNLYGTNTTALEIDPATYGKDSYPNTRHAYLSTREANDYALALTHTTSSTASFPVGVTFDGTSTYKITYDWLTNAPNESGKKSRVRLYQETRDHYQVTKSEGKPYLTTYGWGTTSEVPAIGEWVQAEITYNSATKDVTVKWIKSDGTVILNKTGSQWSTFTDISFIELIGENGGQMIDNVVIAKEVTEEPDVPETPDVPEEPEVLPENTVWSENFNNVPVAEYDEVWAENFEDSKKYTLAGTNQKIETIDGRKVLYGNRAYTLGGVTLPETIVFGTGDVYSLTYDLRRSKDLAVEASVMLSTDSTTSNNSYRFGFKNGCFTSFGWGDAGTVSDVTASTGEWYNCEVLMNYDAKTITYTVYKDGTAIYTVSNDWLSNYTKLASVGLYFPGSSCGAYLDNIVLSKKSANLKYRTLGGQHTDKLEINPSTYGSDSYPNTRHAYLATNGGGYGLQLTYTAYSDAIIPVNATIPAIAGQGVYKLTYDWMTRCGTSTSHFSKVQLGYFKYPIGVTSRKAQALGVSSDVELANNTWYKVEAILNFGTQMCDVTIYDTNGNSVFTAKDVYVSGLTSIDAITLSGVEGAMMIDNIVITSEETELVEGHYEHLLDGATYVEFEADVNYNGTSADNLIFAKSGDKSINLFDIFDGALLSGDAYTKTDTPTGWYNVKMKLDDINHNAIVTVTTPEGAVIQRADPRYISSVSSIEALYINTTTENYKNVSVNTTYTAPETPENDTVRVSISSITKGANKVLGVAQLATSDAVTLNLEYENTDANEANYTIIAAYYNDNDKLLAVEEVEDITAYTVADMTDVDEISFFVWDSLAAIKPLSEKYVIGDMKFTDDEVYGLVTTFYGDEGTTRGFSWTAASEYTDMVIQYAEADQNWDTAYIEKEAIETEYEGLLYYKTDISGLTAGETYVYRIGDSVDDVWSETYKFTTKAENIEEFTFLGITDPQSTAWSGGFEYTAKTLDAALTENPDIAFTVNMGDLVEVGPTESQWNAYFKAFKGISETLPHMAVVGNHETRGDGITAVKNFSLHFNNPKNGADAFGDLTVEDTETVYGDGIITNKSETVYSFDYGNAHFAVLNTGTDFGYNDVVTILTEQAKWLDEDLAATDKKWKIVMIHQSMYPAKTERYSTKVPLLEVIDKYEVDLVLQGHDHVVARSYPMRGDSIVTKLNLDTVTKGTGTVYNILGSVGPKRYDMITNTPECLAVLNATLATQPTYTVFKVDGDSIDVVTKQMNGLVIDEYSIVEKAE